MISINGWKDPLLWIWKHPILNVFAGKKDGWQIGSFGFALAKGGKFWTQICCGFTYSWCLVCHTPCVIPAGFKSMEDEEMVTIPWFQVHQILKFPRFSSPVLLLLLWHFLWKDTRGEVSRYLREIMSRYMYEKASEGGADMVTSWDFGAVVVLKGFGVMELKVEFPNRNQPNLSVPYRKLPSPSLVRRKSSTQKCFGRGYLGLLVPWRVKDSKSSSWKVQAYFLEQKSSTALIDFWFAHWNLPKVTPWKSCELGCFAGQNDLAPKNTGSNLFGSVDSMDCPGGPVDRHGKMDGCFLELTNISGSLSWFIL